jgi:ribosomal protein S18 acetylase RimI-like enzyme
MSASDHLSSLQFTAEQIAPMAHAVEARDAAGEVVAHLSWSHPEEPGGYTRVREGTIIMAKVDPAHQRKGVATEMLRRAREINPAVQHSPNVTDMGSAWSKARP